MSGEAVLYGKTLLVIGGSSGIGLRVAELAAAYGANLLIVGRNGERLRDAQAKLTTVGAASVTILQADAHVPDQLARAFAQCPALDHVVSMVGDVMGGGFLQADIAAIRHVVESKFFANVRIAQLAAPKMRDGASMVFTSGTGGRAQHACGSYVGNLGINALVEGLAVELAPRVRVNAVSPTWTLTPFWRGMPEDQRDATRQRFEQTIPLRRLASIDQLADAYLFVMRNGFINGQHIAVDGGVMLGA